MSVTGLPLLQSMARSPKRLTKIHQEQAGEANNLPAEGNGGGMTKGGNFSRGQNVRLHLQCSSSNKGPAM
jgi:hypothetical protein